MPPTKTLQQREQELRSLLANPAGQKELNELESRYQAGERQVEAGENIGHHVHPSPREGPGLD